MFNKTPCNSILEPYDYSKIINICERKICCKVLTKISIKTNNYFFLKKFINWQRQINNKIALKVKC